MKARVPAIVRSRTKVRTEKQIIASLNPRADMNRLVFSNLLHRPLRSLISVVAIAVEVTLILVIVGLSLGMLNDSKQRTRGIGADVMVQPPNSTIFGAMTGAPVSIKIADKIRSLPHVVAVTPVVTQLSTTGAVEVIYGVELASFERV